jgi:uncharacterized protein (DUF58 family)
LAAEPQQRLALDPEELARLATMAVRARVIVEGAFAGLHHNLHPGSSIEFAEHKEYAPGDEIRRIDWKAVGRQDRYFVKRYEDETEMRTFLVIDASASMGYGRRVSKLTFAGYLGAALAYLLGQQGDPAGLLLFDEGTRRYLPPSTRPGHVRDLLALLDAAAPGGRTALDQALGHVAELADRRSLVLVLTDLLDAEPELPAPQRPRNPGDAPRALGPVAERLAQLRTRGHDVVLFHLLDPDEIDLPFEDLTLFEGMEPADARKLLADPADLRAAFRLESQALRARWRRTCLEARVEYRFTRTDARPGEVLRAFLSERRAGARRAI